MKFPLTIVLVTLTVAAFAAIEIGTLASESVLEPSIQNEVDHALSREFDFASFTGVVHHAEIPAAWTNGLSATDKAIKLISLQNAEGRWLFGTNDVTRSARAILNGL